MDKYSEFVDKMEAKYPRYFNNVYCGISINEGWFHIIDSLCANIHNHITWRRKQRAEALLFNRAKKRGYDALVKYLAGQRKPTEWEIKRATEAMDQDDREIPSKVTHIEIHQIKEKFGGLRFYYQGGDDYVHGMVRMAEAWADSTCELCGQRGSIRYGGWHKCLCDAHNEEREESRKNNA